MQSVEQQLLEYRRTRKAALDRERNGGIKTNPTASGETSVSSSSASSNYNGSLIPNLLKNISKKFADSRLFQSYSSFRANYPWRYRVAVFAIWLTGQWLFAKAEFGSVYFALSVLIFIYANLRSEPKKKGEVSAYSVFNPNCERLPGQMTAEHFESELLKRNAPRQS